MLCTCLWKVEDELLLFYRHMAWVADRVGFATVIVAYNGGAFVHGLDKRQHVLDEGRFC